MSARDDPTRESPREPMPVDVGGSAKRGLLIGASVVIVGLMLVGTGHSTTGGAVELAGWAILGASVHSFGRRAG